MSDDSFLYLGNERDEHRAFRAQLVHQDSFTRRCSTDFIDFEWTTDSSSESSGFSPRTMTLSSGAMDTVFNLGQVAGFQAMGSGVGSGEL